MTEPTQQHNWTRSHKSAVRLGLAVVLTCLAVTAWLTRGVVGGRLQPLDDAVVQWFQQHHRHALDEMMIELTALGGHTVLGLFVFVGVTLLVLCGNWRRAVFLFLTVTGATVLTFVAKELVDRPRPTVGPPLLTPESESFPSGHAFVSMTVYLTFAWFVSPLLPTAAARRFMATAAVVLPLSIGVSRLYLGVHYLTDVVAGWFAGLAWVTACWLLWLLTREPERRAE